MKKKVISLIVAASMVTAALTGCGNKEQATVAGTEEGVNGEGEPYTVTMVLNGTSQPDEERIEEKINEILMPELNAKLDIIVLPWGSADQQLQLLLSGDEKIDCFYSNATKSINFMNSGQIIDMSELVSEYGTNLKEMYGMEAINSNSIQGFLYGVPNEIERGGIPAIFMRKDIVEKYQIDTSTIKEPKDLEAVFEIIKAGEPEMTMLYSSNKDDNPLSRLAGFDTLGDNNWCGVLMDQTESTEVVNPYESEWYMNTANMLHDWYNKGYINKDAATETENWRTVFKAGNLFSIFFRYHPATPVEFQTSTGYEFEIIPFGENATKDSSTYANIIFSMAQNCEDPVKTIQVLDYIYGSPEVMNLLNWGEEGIDYEYVDETNDMIHFPEGVTAESVGYSLNLGWELPNQFIAHLWEGSEPGTWDKMKEFNDKAKESKALGFVFNNEGYENQTAAVINVLEQYLGSINSGAVDPEEYMPQFLEALKNAGINDIITAKQEQLNVWLESK